LDSGVGVGLNRQIPKNELGTPKAWVAENAEFNVRLSQAMEQERAGALDEARTSYLGAVKSPDPTEQEMAAAGLARVETKKVGPLWQFVFGIQSFALVLQRAVVAVGLAVLTTWILLSLIRLIPRRSGFSIGNFSVKGMAKSDGDPAEIALEFRQAIADSLSVIQLIQSNFAGDLALLSESLPVPRFGLPGADHDELATALAGVVNCRPVCLNPFHSIRS
jgi:hypothetical protein